MRELSLQKKESKLTSRSVTYSRFEKLYRKICHRWDISLINLNADSWGLKGDLVSTGLSNLLSYGILTYKFIKTKIRNGKHLHFQFFSDIPKYFLRVLILFIAVLRGESRANWYHWNLLKIITASKNSNFFLYVMINSTSRKNSFLKK